MKRIRLSALKNAKAAAGASEVLLLAADEAGADVEIALPGEHLPPALVGLSSALTDLHRRETGAARSNHMFPANSVEISVRDEPEGATIITHFEIAGGLKLTVALPAAAAPELAQSFAAIARDQATRGRGAKR